VLPRRQALGRRLQPLGRDLAGQGLQDLLGGLRASGIGEVDGLHGTGAVDVYEQFDVLW
jgi:hypothetical protein